jgi:hypothetical protein
MTEELCTNCKKPIPPHEPACVLGSRVVCESCDKSLRDLQDNINRDDPDHVISFIVIYFSIAALLIELIAMVSFIIQYTDNQLPDGPIEMAMKTRIQSHTFALVKIAIDGGLITITVAVLLLALILNNLYKIHHRLRLQSLKPSLD